MHDSLERLARQVTEYRIAVIGDVMLDENIEGQVLRISPEAPVPLMSKEHVRVLPGGAANVASGIAALGARCTLIGLVGNDAAAEDLKRTLHAQHGGTLDTALIADQSRPTTVKTRFWGAGFGPKHLLLRVDAEVRDDCSGKPKDELLGVIRSLRARPDSDGYDTLVISDYAKGVVDPDVLRAAAGTGIPIVIAPKPSRHAVIRDHLRGMHTVLPNYKEAVEISRQYGGSSGDIAAVARVLQQHMGANIVITRGRDGIYALDKLGNIHAVSTKAREIYDVTGAGDVVLAVYAAGICAQLPLKDAICIANYAGSIKVGKVGVATVSIDELMRMHEDLNSRPRQ